jgi:hypothetical protein
MGNSMMSLHTYKTMHCMRTQSIKSVKSGYLLVKRAGVGNGHKRK